MTKTWTILAGLSVAWATGALHAAEIQGDPGAGARKNAQCIGCHGIPGYRATFPQVHQVPMISGQGAGYIAAVLHAYKKGERKHPTMRGVAESLSDQDIADLAAYYQQSGAASAAAPQPAPAPTPDVAALLQKGGCVACHGANFAQPLDPSYPKLAGQHADYLFVALKAYKGEGRATLIGRSNGIMAGVAQQFSNAELQALAGYMGALDGGLRTVPEPRFR